MTHGDPRATPHLVSRAREFLDRSTPADAATIAREVLGIHGATPAVAARLVSSLLDGVAGFTRERGDIWSVVSRNSPMAESGNALARPDLLVAGGSAGRVASGAIECIDIATGEFRPGNGAAAIERFRLRLTGDHALRREDTASPGEGTHDDDSEIDPGGDGSAFVRFASRIAGMTIVAYRPRELLGPVIDWMIMMHSMSLDVDAVSLSRLARRLEPDLAHQALEELAAGLGLTHYASERAEDQAHLAGLVLSELLSRSGFSGPVTAESLLAFEDAATEPRDFTRFAFDESWLAELPETPGIYRMFDAAGDLIYVGKAASLRRRVGQYFRSTGARDERVERILAELHRIDIEETGSELAALLAEEREIRERAPRLNVQRDVLPRPHRPPRARNLALIAKGAEPETATAFFYQPPYAVVPVVLPLAGPLDEAAREAVIALLSREPVPAGKSSPSAPERGALEIVRSWIHLRRGETVIVDLEASPHHEDAIRRIEDARSSLGDRDATEHR